MLGRKNAATASGKEPTCRKRLNNAVWRIFHLKALIGNTRMKVGLEALN
jgi:hypothetical protein